MKTTTKKNTKIKKINEVAGIKGIAIILN